MGVGWSSPFPPASALQQSLDLALMASLENCGDRFRRGRVNECNVNLGSLCGKVENRRPCITLPYQPSNIHSLTNHLLFALLATNRDNGPTIVICSASN